MLLLICACASPGRESPAPQPSVETEPVAASPEAMAEEAGTQLAESEQTQPAQAESAPPDAFFDEVDAPHLDALRHGAVMDAERGRGGRSLGFKLTLADGTVGYYKPEQSFSGAHWFSEIAAYQLDRELGFGRVPPVIGRRLVWSRLRRAARGDPRIPEVTVADDGTVRGAFVWWIPGGLHALQLPDGWEHWIRLSALLPVTPYERPAQVRAALRRDGSHPPHESGSRPDPDRIERPLELSDLIIFDYLTSNVDRWGGGFTNARVRDTTGDLVYLDNGAGFWPNARLGLMDRRLHALQRFRRSTIDALEHFDLAHYRQRLASDPLAPVINESQIAGVEQRRVEVLRHVRELVERFGEESVILED